MAMGATIASSSRPPPERMPVTCKERLNLSLQVTGILSGGGPEDDAIVAPIAIAEQNADKPGEYRRLYVSALTKPEDEFGRRDPNTLGPADYERWYCTP